MLELMSIVNDSHKYLINTFNIKQQTYHEYVQLLNKNKILNQFKQRNMLFLFSKNANYFTSKN